MGFNLTSKQKDALRLLVDLGRSWREEFEIIWHDAVNLSDVLGYDGDPPQVSRGEIRALEREGLVICDFLGNTTARIILTPRSFEAVDSGFEMSISQLQGQRYGVTAMTESSIEQPRPALTMSRGEAEKRIQQQIDKAENIPNVSVIENDEAERWYNFTAELLRRICTTDELTDEFTGRSGISIGGDVSVGHYVKKLHSILDRLELYPEEVSQHSVTVPPSDPLKDVERVIDRFHAVVAQLRHRRTGRPTLEVNDEYDVQYLFHALLQLYFDDIRPEEWTPSYAGSSSRIDFLLKPERIVVEVKKTRSGLEDKGIGDQLSIDIMKYRSHPDCGCLICFVYDPEERIRNPRGLEQDLSRPLDALDVKVYITPKQLLPNA